MTESNGDPLFEDKFARVYAEVRRIDQLRQTDSAATKDLALERDRHLFDMLQAQKEAVAVALAQAEKASDKAAAAQEAVNRGQNEFRGSLNDYVKELVPRKENDQIIAEIRGLVAALANQLTDLRSRIDVGPPSLSTLQARSDEGIGRRGGMIEQRALIFAAIAACVGVAGIVLALAAFVTK
jgi:hypothetical protein